ncbi:MAG: hypothetical protein JEZ06_09515 [Anaerolineaceae bacterium]|nr:hypothetical protein [Anaerolineaceae bacterium]
MKSMSIKSLLFSLILLLALSACGPTKAEQASTATQLVIEQGRTMTAEAFYHAASLTAAAPTYTSTPTQTPEPTLTFTPEPTFTPTVPLVGELSGKVYWLEGGGPVATYLYLKAVDGGKTQEYSVSTKGNFSFTDIQPGTYMYEFQISLDNPVFGPCSQMGFNAEAEGISYSMSIINGEMKLVIGKSETFRIEAGDKLEIDLPFSFICQ